MRCESKHPTQGTQCGLPEGHNGAHANGTICHPWNDELPPALKPTINVIKHADLPLNTMMVSADLYEQMKSKYIVIKSKSELCPLCGGTFDKPIGNCKHSK